MTHQKQASVLMRKHGKTQLELVVQYPIQQSGIGCYSLNLWFFIPSSLQINEKNYTVTNFFSDVNCLTRFGVPVLSLSRLIDPSCKISPLTRIREEIENAILGKDINVKRILYELRILAGVYASETDAAEKLIANTVDNGPISSCLDSVRKMLKEVQFFLDEWRNFYGILLKPTVVAKIRDAYNWTDESISLSTETFLYHIYWKLKTINNTDSIRKKIQKLMEKELSHRQEVGYRIIYPDSDALAVEQRINRESILKKWAQSALYLSQEESHAGNQFRHILAGISAATAMTFAVIATLLANKYLSGKSLPWILAIVGSYIFKDRIKESLREVLIRTIPGLVTDERIRLFDQATGDKIGRIKSRVRIMGARNTFREIHQDKTFIKNTLQKIHPKEDIIHYRREIIINNKRLNRFHIRMDTITDIVRLKLDDMLRNMDLPEKSVPTFATAEPSEKRGRRVYRIYLLINLKSPGKVQHVHQKCHLVLSRNGIERIEKE